MLLRYHQCGYPLQVEEEQDSISESITYYELGEVPEGPGISVCPGCGELLLAYSLSDEPPMPERMLIAWARVWPDLRAQLESQLLRQSWHSSQFGTYEQELKLAQFDHALHVLVELSHELSKACTLLDDELEASAHLRYSGRG